MPGPALLLHNKINKNIEFIFIDFPKKISFEFSIIDRILFEFDQK